MIFGNIENLNEYTYLDENINLVSWLISHSK